jgi:hypothetical protein
MRHAWTTRSATVGIPSRRYLPGDLGINRCRTGAGTNAPDLTCSRKPDRNAATAAGPSAVIARAVTRSTPAVRAPRLPATRSQAITRKAGSTTRLNKSSNRAVVSPVDHRCNLACIPSTRARACDRLGHGASVFTGDLLAWQHPRCGLAAALGHVDGFPVRGLLRRLRPPPRPSGDGGPARRAAGSRPGRAGTAGFPCSPRGGRRGRCPALLRQHRREYAAGFPRGLPDRHQ